MKVEKNRTIDLTNLIEEGNVKGIVDNYLLYPPENAQCPDVDFEGTLEIAGTKMDIAPSLTKKVINEKDVTYFPEVSLSFLTVDHKWLVPVTQNVIEIGSLVNSESYWDIIVQPGRLWKNNHENWNWASFPFSLVNRLEGETHIGVAFFGYRNTEVTNVRFQIVAETAPFDIAEHFVAWGVTKASYQVGSINNIEKHRDIYRRHLKERIPKADFLKLKNRVDETDLKMFHGATNLAEEDDVLQVGLFYDGVLYRSLPVFAGGPFPYGDEIRYGVWSVTKVAMMNVAMLRLAQKYGDDLLDEKIANYIEVPTELNKWQQVTFLDMANMASGRGSVQEDPTCYLCDYHRWYLAKTTKEKVTESLNYPWIWNAGKKYNYRDQDAFLLGVALENYIRSREGESASLLHMLKKEVYEPIGIYYFAANDTIEKDETLRYLRLDFGYYATLDDLVKISLLYQSKGKWNGEQILSQRLIEEVLPQNTPSTLAVSKEEENSIGPSYYLMNWHIEPYVSSEGCKLYIPNMSGYGGNLVTLMPNNIVGLRIARQIITSKRFNSTMSQSKVGNQLVSFCRDK